MSILITQELQRINSASNNSTEYNSAIKNIKELMSPECRKSLEILVINGPIKDSEINIECRDILIYWGFASKACINGNIGYTVANNKGWDIHNTIL